MYAESLENEWPLVWTVYLIKGGRGKVKIPRRQFSHFPLIFKTKMAEKMVIMVSILKRHNLSNLIEVFKKKKDHT